MLSSFLDGCEAAARRHADEIAAWIEVISATDDPRAKELCRELERDRRAAEDRANQLLEERLRAVARGAAPA